MKKVILLLLITLKVVAQTPTSELIDSLNLTNNNERKIELYSEIAWSLKDTDWTRALKYLELSEIEVKKTNQKSLQAIVYKTAAEIYASKDALDVAIDYYHKAYDIYKGGNNFEQAAKIENNLAVIYGQSNNQDKALQYFFHVYSYQKQNKDTVELVKALNNIGTAYLKKNLDSSLFYYKKAQNYINTVKNATLKAYISTNLGRTYSLKNDTLQAAKYFNNALQLMDSTMNESLYSFIHQSISQHNLKEKEYYKAIFHAEKALEFNEHKPISFISQNLSNILFNAYSAVGNYKEAVKHYQNYNTIRDSLNTEEKAVNLERIKLEQAYKSRNKIRLLNEEKQRFKLYLIGLFLIIGVLSLSILLIKYRNKHIKNELEQEKLKRKQQELKQNLEEKNKVLIGKAMTEIHRTDIINNILIELKQIKLKAIKKETQQAIDYILKKLQKDLNIDIWKEFEISFEQVHQSFYNNLSKNHPSLTPKDRRLCALLYLDLTTKEIAQITGQSFKSVENARTRLRKKLNLTNEKINLSTYLNSFSA